jgi:hypothetical protein
MRNPSADLDYDNITGDTEQWFTRGNMVRTRRSKRKSKKSKQSYHRSSTRHRRHRKHKMKQSHSKKSRKGKRPFPHWLKKYWFKKKR